MFYIEQDNKIVLFDEDKTKIENTILFMPQYKDLEIKETQRPIVDFMFSDTEEYQVEQAAKEAERIRSLTLTKRVFALALQQIGISYSQLKTLISSNEQAQLEWDLCVELERSNPLLDIMAEKMGITSEQLDYIFRKGNGEDVELPASETEDSVNESEEL